MNTEIAGGRKERTGPRTAWRRPGRIRRAMVLGLWWMTGAVLTGFPGAAGPARAQDLTFFDGAGCLDCHGAESRKGNLNLTGLTWNPAEPGNTALWEKIHDRVDRGEMPPPGRSRPEPAVRAAFLAGVAGPLHDLAAARQAERGRTGLRRLNRAEYENTVQPLLGITAPLRDALPEEGSGQTFDTVADGLRFSQLQIEKYLEAADLALDAALLAQPRVKPFVRRTTLLDEKDIVENMSIRQGKPEKENPENKHQVLFRKVGKGVGFFADTYQLGLDSVKAPATAEWRVRISGYAFQSRGQPVTLVVQTDNYKRRVVAGAFELPPDKPRVIELTLRMEEGEFLRLEPHGTNFDDDGRSNWGTDAAEYRGVGMVIDWLELEGPVDAAWPPRSLELTAGKVPRKEYGEGEYPWRDGRHIAFELVPPDPAAALRAHLPGLAERAWRYPVPEEETGFPLHLALAALAGGAPYEEALRTGVKAILTSPQFLLFPEKPGELDAWALASRLSYFLWSGPPDEALRTAAADGSLTRPEVLLVQTRRLLADSRSQRFVSSFAGQWLGLRNIDATSPDPMLYPEFDEVLKRSMTAETEAFLTEMIQADRPVADFIRSDWLMLNRRLSRHYGIPGPLTERFERTAVPPGSPRGGLLTQAAILKVTANGTTTSPVVRGTWVMKRLLGRPPPPPPPVPAIEPDTRGASTVRELLARHRSSTTCNACHRSIDPPGFALESFDVIGGWRDRYRSLGAGDPVPGKLNGNGIWQYRLAQPVDASGELPDGQAFADITAFRTLLLRTELEAVRRTVAGKLLVYGTGAELDFADRRAVAEIAEKARGGGDGFRTLIETVVLSPQFRRK